MTARAQRRGRVIAMSPAELDEFLATERTCRMATTGANGRHTSPRCGSSGTGVAVAELPGTQPRWTDLSATPGSRSSWTPASNSTNCAAWSSAARSKRSATSLVRPTPDPDAGRAGVAVRPQVQRPRRVPDRPPPRRGCGSPRTRSSAGISASSRPCPGSEGASSGPGEVPGSGVDVVDQDPDVEERYIRIVHTGLSSLCP